MTSITTHPAGPTGGVSSPPRTSTRRELRAGARAMLPWLAGVVPFGITIGVTVAESSVDPLAGWATGALVYAGSAQLLAIELLDQGAAPVVIVFTVLAVNARLVVYSGAMAPHWRETSRSFRGLAAYLLIDPSFAVGTEGYEGHDDRHRGHAHYLGCAVTLWVAWQAALGIGILAGTAAPDASTLAMVVPFYLVAEVVRVARSRPAVAAAAVGAIVAVTADGMPFHSGSIAAILAGVAVATVLEERKP